MPEPEEAAFDYGAWRQDKMEKGSTTWRLRDGSVMTIPPPLLWPELFEEIEGEWDEEGNLRRRGFSNAKCLRLILGDEQAERFTADGGDWMILNTMVRDKAGKTAGE